MKIVVLSHEFFDKKMRILGLNDKNVEDVKMAFISIIGTEECLKYWLKESDTRHYFTNHPNVLNLEFDDIGNDVMYHGHHFRTMRMNQAEDAIDFIEKMIDSDIDTIYIHCRAGMSRSRAFGEFIYRYCNEHDIEIIYEDRDDYTTILNQGILRRLNHAYWKKHKLECYEDLESEYPNDLVDVPIEEIN